MPRIQRHRAASGQGRALRGPLRKAGRADKQHPAESGAGANQGKAGSPKAAAKATPSPRKAEPARAAAPVDRSKAVKPEANGKPRQKSRVVRRCRSLRARTAPLALPPRRKAKCGVRPATVCQGRRAQPRSPRVSLHALPPAPHRVAARRKRRATSPFTSPMAF